MWQSTQELAFGRPVGEAADGATEAEKR